MAVEENSGVQEYINWYSVKLYIIQKLNFFDGRRRNLGVQKYKIFELICANATDLISSAA